MRPLSLAANIGNWRIFTARKSDPGFRALSKKILARDRHTCQFCGFQAKEFLDIVNLDNNYYHNSSANMVTACCFCSQCLFLESIGIEEYGGGWVIYLPEMTQGELNSFCHVLFCAMANGTAYKDTAESIYRTLKFRAQVVDEQFGSGSSNPATFGQMIMEAYFEQDEQRQEVLAPLRVLPSRAKFASQIEAWAAAALAEISEE